MRSAALVSVILAPALLACGGMVDLPTDVGPDLEIPIPAPSPPDGPAQHADDQQALGGYGYVPGPPPRFTRFNTGEEVFVGVDGAKLRVAGDAESDVVAELAHGERVTVLETLEPPAYVIGRTNAWVRVKTATREGVVFGAVLTPIGGEGFSESLGDYRWTVTWSKDFHPLVRATGSGTEDHTRSLVLHTTGRFQGGILQAEASEWGDFEARIDVTQCAVGPRPEGPRCSTGSAVTSGSANGLTALTPPDAYQFAPSGPAETPSCTDAPAHDVRTSAQPVLIRTVDMPSYMRGPSTSIPCSGLGTLQGGTHDGATVIACSVDESGKSWPPEQSTHWYISTSDDEWKRLHCMGSVNGELEQHLGYGRVAVLDTVGLVLKGRLAPPPDVLHTTDRGLVGSPHHWPGELPMSEVDEVFSHESLGPVYRARKSAKTAPWGLLVPRAEGGFLQYTWQPDLSDLTLDGVPSPGTYRAKDEMGDWFARGVKELDLTKVGTAGGGPVYSLRPDHPLQAVFTKLHAEGPSSEPLPELPWLFVEGPFGGYYAIMREGVARPLAAEPILYAYADEPTDLSIRFGDGLDVRGTHPRTVEGWDTRVLGDGRMLVDGERLDRLFWDGASTRYGPPDTGWMVPRPELETFLRDTLPALGLNRREVDEAVEAWLPSVPDAAWVRVGLFPRATIDQVGPLLFEPEPDTLIRVWVELTPLDEPAPIAVPTIEPVERKGLTVVEWGYVVR